MKRPNDLTDQELPISSALPLQLAQLLERRIWPIKLRTTGRAKMLAPGIISGHVTQINPASGQWMIVDVGFSSRGPTCGVWTAEGGLGVVTLGGLIALATREVQAGAPEPLNLLIEAPLSVAFQPNGNPARRACDIFGKRYRDWYVNAGGTTYIAAGYLLRALHACQIQRQVRLFEGHLSFKMRAKAPKSREERTAAHIEDAADLREAVWSGANAQIFAPDQLLQDNAHRIEPSSPFLGKDVIAPVIRINPQR